MLQPPYHLPPPLYYSGADRSSGPSNNYLQLYLYFWEPALWRFILSSLLLTNCSDIVFCWVTPLPSLGPIPSLNSTSLNGMGLRLGNGISPRFFERGGVWQAILSLTPWIVEHRGLETCIYGIECELHQKCMYSFKTSGVKLCNILLWAYTCSRPIQRCKRWASEQPPSVTGGTAVHGIPIITFQGCFMFFSPFI